MAKIRQWYKKKRVLVLELVLFYFIPLYLMDRFSHIGVLRHGLMIMGAIYVIFFMKVNRFTLEKMGLHKENLGRAGAVTILLSLVVGLVTLVVVTVIPSLLSEGLMGLKVLPLPIPVLILGYVLFSVPLQEFLFRGFMITRLELITNNRWVVILVSAALFALAHLMFRNTALIAFCFVAGIIWGWLFVKYRSLWPVQLSHALLGSVMIWLVLK